MALIPQNVAKYFCVCILVYIHVEIVVIHLLIYLEYVDMLKQSYVIYLQNITRIFRKCIIFTYILNEIQRYDYQKLLNFPVVFICLHRICNNSTFYIRGQVYLVFTKKVRFQQSIIWGHK